MKVTVKLFAFLRQGRFSLKEMEFREGTNVAEVMEQLGISPKEMEIGIILVNGKHGFFDSILQDGDILSIFPPAAGG